MRLARFSAREPDWRPRRTEYLIRRGRRDPNTRAISGTNVGSFEMNRSYIRNSGLMSRTGGCVVLPITAGHLARRLIGQSQQRGNRSGTKQQDQRPAERFVDGTTKL